MVYLEGRNLSKKWLLQSLEMLVQSSENTSTASGPSGALGGRVLKVVCASVSRLAHLQVSFVIESHVSSQTKTVKEEKADF